MSFVSIDPSRCVNDGHCVEACPAGLFDLSSEAPPVYREGGDINCIQCGHCVAVCPTMALTHTEIPVENCVPIQPRLEITAETAEQFIKSRRSIRRYLPEPVSRNEIEKILDITRFAPSGHNDQDISWRVFNKPEEVKAITEAVVAFFKYFATTPEGKESPVNPEGIVKTYEQGEDNILRGARTLLVAMGPKDSPMAMVGGAIYLTTLELAAKALGLGTCWAGYVMIAASMGFKPVLELLKIPEEKQFAGAMMLGYPTLEYPRIPTRKATEIYWD